MVGGDEGTEHPHVIYKATASHTETCGNNKGQWIPFHELHKGEFIRRVKLMKAQQASQQIDKKDKEMKLALVLDNSMFYKLNLSSEDIVQYVIQTANMLDLYYKDMNIRTPLVYIEYWNSENKIDVGPNLRKLLQRFLHYKTENLIGIDHHSAHLITGTDLEDNSVGMAIPDSICTDRAISISKSPNILEPQQLATILSHMIGHNLGIKHDEDVKGRDIYSEGPCTCNDEFGCIMSADVLERTGLHSRMFSSCSLSDLDVALSIDVASCLKKDNTEMSFKQTCGNMHVERGEECDCGPSEEECEVIDPCCDAKTCLLKSWTQCRNGACCHNCTFLPKEHVCRESSTDCDVPEHCTGTGGECPENNYIADGHPCLNNTGYCLGGICPTLDLQCQHIWGKEAYGADMQCFEKFNPTGNFNGHCGKDDRTGSFAKCLPEDVQCGLLHCEGGSTTPLYGSAGSDRAYSETLMSINGEKYGCKVIHGPALMELPNHGLVQEGTKCGDGKFCMRKQCVPASTRLLTCPGTDSNRICSGHGVS
ncbi:hypothetical protein KUTeg_008632 [Tegillarca granosa]|uniref:Uncharacterized protein n=1 Tax=Tegillarca granosa TaxID=220873 RepID=A0ABQ9FBU1_TEGGR|nr:hypothetical protein KUTeg_008632 [Tegillarca granosa]